jgi:RNA polymerase sigma factor (sigma-70 family)
MAKRAGKALPQVWDDLQSAAYLALVEAAQSFDPSRKVDFAAFARHRIDGALRDVRRESIQHTPRPEHGHSAESDRVGLEVESGSWILDAVPAAPVGSDLEDLETVQAWISRLPRLQSQALYHIYLEGKTQEEAAALIGCSPPTLSRIHKDAIASIQFSRRLE